METVFEYDVILNGSKTVFRLLVVPLLFEYDVILNGSKTIQIVILVYP